MNHKQMRSSLGRTYSKRVTGFSASQKAVISQTKASVSHTQRKAHKERKLAEKYAPVPVVNSDAGTDGSERVPEDFSSDEEKLFADLPEFHSEPMTNNSAEAMWRAVDRMTIQHEREEQAGMWHCTSTDTAYVSALHYFGAMTLDENQSKDGGNKADDPSKEGGYMADDELEYCGPSACKRRRTI